MVIHSDKKNNHLQNKLSSVWTNRTDIMDSIRKGATYIGEKTAVASRFTGKVFAKAGRFAFAKTVALCAYTGEAAITDLTLVRERTAPSATAAKSAVAEKIGQACSTIFGRLVRFGKALIHPFIGIAHAPRLISNSYRQGGVPAAMGTCWQGVKNNSYFMTTILNYAAPVVGIFILVNVVTTATAVDYALAIEQDGQVVAYVEDESVFTEAQKDVRERIISTSEGQSFAVEPSFSVVAVNKEQIAPVETVTDSIIRMSSADILDAQGLYIDGEFYGAVTDKTLLETSLNSILAEYETGAENEKVEFIKDISLKSGLFLTDSIVEGENVESLLTSDVQAKRTYTIVKGDSPTLIASKNDIPYQEFKSMNPGIETRCMIGDEAVIANKEPFLSVRVTRQETYTESIPYETEVTKDNSKNKGYTQTVQEGKAGSKSITASVVYVNDTEESREVLSTSVVAEPVTKKVVEGTKVQTYSSNSAYVPSSTGSGTVSGNFIRPVSTGYISCYYGSRGHGGIDIAAPYGTPVRASAAGKVVVSGWYYTYGKCVVIDHGNGVRTLYGHNSSLNVSVGDRVSQGQTIALVGSTGYSTGNHCHFEVQVNGRTRNPLNYIGG